MSIKLLHISMRFAKSNVKFKRFKIKFNMHSEKILLITFKFNIFCGERRVSIFRKSSRIIVGNSSI